VVKSSIELTVNHVREPFLVNINKCLETLKQFNFIKGGHVKMNRGLNELFQMIVRSERLELTSILILDHVDALMARDTVVQCSGRSCQLQRSIGNDLRITPATIDIPINGEHVVGESLSENEFSVSLWLQFLNLSLLDLNISSFETVDVFLVNDVLGHQAETSSLVGLVDGLSHLC